MAADACLFRSAPEVRGRTAPTSAASPALLTWGNRSLRAPLSL